MQRAGLVKGCGAIWEYAAAVEGIHLLADSFFFAALFIPGRFFTSSPLIKIQKSTMKLKWFKTCLTTVSFDGFTNQHNTLHGNSKIIDELSNS